MRAVAKEKKVGEVKSDEQGDEKKWLLNCHSFLRALVL
jgi:hypothetical protein